MRHAHHHQHRFHHPEGPEGREGQPAEDFGPGPRWTPPFGGPEGAPFGGPFRGRPGRPRRGGRREGALRAAVLALLDSGPRHGYRIITELAEQSGGGWRPSPGSVYPLLQQLTDEGLVTSTEVEGRRTYQLSEEGRRRVELHREELSEKLGRGVGHGARRELFGGFHALGRLVHEAAEHGTPAQHEAVLRLLDRTRRDLHAILAADDDSLTAEAPSDAGEAGSGSSGDRSGSGEAEAPDQGE